MTPIEASKIIADEYAVKILVATHRRPKGAIELSQKLGIPIAACYRRIKSLEENNLLHCVERVLTQKGKRMSVYISNLKNAYVYLDDSELKVRFELTNGQVMNFDDEIKIHSAQFVELLTVPE